MGTSFINIFKDKIAFIYGESFYIVWLSSSNIESISGRGECLTAVWNYASNFI